MDYFTKSLSILYSIVYKNSMFSKYLRYKKWILCHRDTLFKLGIFNLIQDNIRNTIDKIAIRKNTMSPNTIPLYLDISRISI